MDEKKIRKALEVIVTELAKDQGYKLDKEEKEQVILDLFERIESDFDCIAHNATTDFVC